MQTLEEVAGDASTAPYLWHACNLSVGSAIDMGDLEGKQACIAWLAQLAVWTQAPRQTVRAMLYMSAALHNLPCWTRPCLQQPSSDAECRCYGAGT